MTIGDALWKITRLLFWVALGLWIFFDIRYSINWSWWQYVLAVFGLLIASKFIAETVNEKK